MWECGWCKREREREPVNRGGKEGGDGNESRGGGRSKKKRGLMKIKKKKKKKKILHEREGGIVIVAVKGSAYRTLACHLCSTQRIDSASTTPCFVFHLPSRLPPDEFERKLLNSPYLILIN